MPDESSPNDEKPRNPKYPPSRTAGLIPFKKGDEWTGNRAGRPKGRKSLTTLIRKALRSSEIQGQPTPDGRTVAEYLVESMIAQAMKGNGTYMREIMNRIDGLLVPPERADAVGSVADAMAVIDRIDAELAARDETTDDEQPE